MYCQERNDGIDAAHFVDYYASRGWVIGKQNMKDWKAAVRTWEQNNYANDRIIAANSTRKNVGTSDCDRLLQMIANGEFDDEQTRNG